MKKLPALLIIVLLSGNIVMAADNSLQIHENVNISLNQSFSGHVFIFETFRNDMSDLYYYENMVGFLYHFPFRWLMGGPMYRHAFSQGAAGEWGFEHAPNIWLIFNYTIDPGLRINFFWLSRHEYRIAETWHNYRMRNFFRIMLPSLKVQPYIACEIFYSKEQEKFYLFHLQPGLQYPIWGPLTLGLYYRLYFPEFRDWENSDNTLGFEVTMNLRHVK